MPHYGVNTQLNKKQMEKLRLAKEKLAKETQQKQESTYKFLRKACMTRIEKILKKEKNNERENSESGIEGRGQEALKVSY